MFLTLVAEAIHDTGADAGTPGASPARGEIVHVAGQVGPLTVAVAEGGRPRLSWRTVEGGLGAKALSGGITGMRDAR